jgi:hypothetical protein
MSNEVNDMMLNDSKDLLDNVEITTIALECQKLKNIEDEISRTEETLKNCWTLQRQMVLVHNKNLMWLGTL